MRSALDRKGRLASIASDWHGQDTEPTIGSLDSENLLKELMDCLETYLHVKSYVRSNDGSPAETVPDRFERRL